MIKLLLVEDDANLSYVIKGSLEDIIGGYEVVTASNGKEGLAMWKKHQPDVIIADIEMPEMNGFEMVEKIREIDGETLVLFASGRISSKDVTVALKLGGNNYVKKPFIPEELDAHVHALLKLKNDCITRNESQVRRIGTYTFDAINGMLKDEEGQLVHLTAREAQILYLLVINRGNIVKRETILEQFWGTEGNEFYASRSLDVFINNLRKKLSKDPSVEIKVVKGIGISLVVKESIK